MGKARLARTRKNWTSGASADSYEMDERQGLDVISSIRQSKSDEVVKRSTVGEAGQREDASAFLLGAAPERRRDVDLGKVSLGFCVVEVVD